MITGVSLPPEAWVYIDARCERTGRSLDLELGRYFAIGLLLYLADELAPYFYEDDEPYQTLVRIGQNLGPPPWEGTSPPAPVGEPVKAKAKTPAEAPGAKNTDKEASS